MDVDDTGMLRLVQGQRSHLYLGQIDTAQSDTLVDVSHQGLANWKGVSQYVAQYIQSIGNHLPSIPMARWASSVLPPMWGVMMRLLKLLNSSPQVLRLALK
jgi:hypothetical protein